MVHDGTRPDYELPPSSPFTNEGKTIAGWVMFWGVCLGALVTGLGMILSYPLVMWGGVAIIVIGLIVAKVLSVTGMGQPRNRDNPPGPGEANWYA